MHGAKTKGSGNFDLQPCFLYMISGLRRFSMVKDMAQQYHPDSHELDDWAIYGPKNPEISTLVERLARRHGLRLQEIEALLLRTLKDRISQEEAQQPT